MYERARLVTGDRGVGKTVFLAHLADDAAAAGDWAVRVTARRGDAIVPELLVRVAETLAGNDLATALTSGVRDALDRVAGIGLGTRGLTVDTRPASPPEVREGDRGRALADLLVEAGRLAKDRGRVLLLLDEVQNVDDTALGEICHALQHAQGVANVETGPRGERLRNHLPLVIYLAGLPGVPDQFRRAGATFFERVAHHDFGLLADAEVRDAFRAFLEGEGVGMDADALDVVVEAIGGYPFFLHLIGARVWASGSGEVVTLDEARRGIAEARVDVAGFYGQRLQGLGEVQYDWLLAAARLDPDVRTVGAVAAALGGTSDRWGWVSRALTEQGLIPSLPGRGRFRLALPGLDRYLRAPSDPNLR